LRNGHSDSISCTENSIVPSSSTKFLNKSLDSPSTTVTYDLEDSVHPSQKDTARSNLTSFLSSHSQGRKQFLAVRPNSPFTPKDDYVNLSDEAEGNGGIEDTLQLDSWGNEDIKCVWGSLKQGSGPIMLLPKVCSNLFHVLSRNSLIMLTQVNHSYMLTAIDQLVSTSRTGTSEPHSLPYVNERNLYTPKS
jgi:hypothetical protein